VAAIPNRGVKKVEEALRLFPSESMLTSGAGADRACHPLYQRVARIEHQHLIDGIRGLVCEESNEVRSTAIDNFERVGRQIPETAVAAQAPLEQDPIAPKPASLAHVATTEECTPVFL